MQKRRFLPAAAVVLGGAGFLLRRWELSTAFEPSGLVTSGMPATMALTVLSILAAVLCAAAGSALRKQDLGRFDDLFALEGRPALLSGLVLSAFLLLAGAALELVQIPASYRAAVDGLMANGTGSPILAAFLPAALALLSLLSGIGILLAARKRARGQSVGPYSGLLLAPGFLGCLWLIAAYQSRAGDPVVQDYLYELLAIMCVLLSSYYLASFSYEDGKAGRCLCFSLLAVYFSITTLADGHDWSSMVLYGFGILYPLTVSVLLLSREGSPRTAHASPAEKEQKTEGDPNER